MFIDIAGAHLAAVEWGGAERTFVAHGGWVGTSELWQEPFQRMHASWRCITYDHRGSGVSDFGPADISADALVDDLFRVLDHFSVDCCVLAGESLGALTCLTAVLRDPSRFEGLVLVDGAAAGNREATRALVEGSRTDYPATVQWFVDACVPEPDSEHVRRWGRQILARAEPEAAARLFEAHDEIAPDLAAVKVPTLVLHGEQDSIIPLEVAEVVAGTIPGARLVTIPGAGHVPTLTRPAEVVEAIESWYAALPA